MKNSAWKMIKKICLTIGAVLIFVICELFILSLELAAAFITGGGIVCLIGLFVPAIRDNVIVVDFVLNLQWKLFVMGIVGILFSVAGGFGTKKVSSCNLRFCRYFYNKGKAFIAMYSS